MELRVKFQIPETFPEVEKFYFKIEKSKKADRKSGDCHKHSETVCAGSFSSSSSSSPSSSSFLIFGLWKLTF